MKRLFQSAGFLVPVLFLLSPAELPAQSKPGDNFKRENLVAWCIVPFDAKKRGPEARTKMLVELGLKRCAYDWRQQHVKEFEQEILQYKKHGIAFTAFWGAHDEAFRLFKKHGIQPAIWQTLPGPRADSQAARVKAAAEAMRPLAERTKAAGCRLGLYNHGGWGGEPANLAAVCAALHAMGHTHVGIVYNLHHGHGHIADFADALSVMKPHLLCLNLNGMNDGAKPKILTVGKGMHDRAMIKAVIDSGYKGPIGILGHVASADVKIILQNNLSGLESLLRELGVAP